MGYAIGAILTGVIADLFGIPASILIIGLLTISSALIIKFRMNCGGNDSVRVLQWMIKKLHRSDKVNIAITRNVNEQNIPLCNTI